MKLGSLILAALTFGVAMPAMAADLPQSGSFKIHSAFKASDQLVQLGEKQPFYGSANAWGVTYNDAGSGPLHMGTALCAYSYDGMNDSSTNGGRCAWGDADGDKIFSEFTGKGTATGAGGMITLTGGSGKFAGIQGNAQWQCKTLNASQGLLACTQQFEYQLTPAVGTSTPPSK
jgi:hypothetical protein